LCDFGAEILIETARFWTSRVSFVDGLFHILKVVGPDEYHHSVDDNAYTNWMAKFNLEKALWACSLIAERKPDAYKNLALRLSLREGELDDWKHVAQNLLIAKPDKNGVIEQFRGFRGLTDVAIPQEQRHHAPISRLFNWKELNKLKVVKQADVLMIPFLFPEALPREVVEANFDYYDPLTDYGSSLGLCIQAAIAGQLGRGSEALRSWEESLYYDLEDTMSNTAVGIHAGAMGGTWQALVFHILGVHFTDDGPRVRNENLSQELKNMKLKLQFRGKCYSIEQGVVRSDPK
jgi:trehalose/maltose hydrolase-like predicted phosphorylase